MSKAFLVIGSLQVLYRNFHIPHSVNESIPASHFYFGIVFSELPNTDVFFYKWETCSVCKQAQRINTKFFSRCCIAIKGTRCSGDVLVCNFSYSIRGVSNPIAKSQ